MKKFIEWFSASIRWRYYVGGCLIGFGFDDWYCALYAGLGIAAALELKNKRWGGKWDWDNLWLTAIGAVTGQLIRCAIWN